MGGCVAAVSSPIQLKIRPEQLAARLSLPPDRLLPLTICTQTAWYEQDFVTPPLIAQVGCMHAEVLTGGEKQLTINPELQSANSKRENVLFALELPTFSLIQPVPIEECSCKQKTLLVLGFRYLMWKVLLCGLFRSCPPMSLVFAVRRQTPESATCILHIGF